MQILLDFIIFLEALLFMALGTMLASAFLAAWQETWSRYRSDRPSPPTLADYRRAFAVEPEWEWATA